MTKKQYEDEVERLAPSLRRIAYSIVRNEHDAQDAVQQALLAVWARRECVEFARLKPYLTRAVMNACRDIQRARQKAIPMKEMPEMSYQPPDGMLADAVERLPEELRLPLLLHYMEGYKLAEIAGALGQSLPQVTSRLFRARKRLKRMLEEAEA
ncbi:MAG: RNA polymerase sigma factor [Christensenellales bacterium]|jgi:RNA polymerase sigma-70 factor (ECF subfamily)